MGQLMDMDNMMRGDGNKDGQCQCQCWSIEIFEKGMRESCCCLLVVEDLKWRQ